ncbi:hypothetical protein HNQ59_000116 [Chitinivorax tropicus]|uniref:Uncharacterized protein n=1 Tax=Chitinivorax tropicus TaxID=714531 RepID=A0A840MC02_9PROT|nr:hypothetical protein [Chitinivorax tropicus]
MGRMPLMLVAVLALPACTILSSFQFRPLVEATSGERARIRAIVTYGSLAVTPNKSCAAPSDPQSGMAIMRTPVGNPGFTGRSIGIPDDKIQYLDKADYAEFYATANAPITFTLMDFGGRWHCVAPSIYFIPEANKDYEVEYIHDVRAGVCGVRVRSLPNRAVVMYSETGLCRRR